ncbi:unnamed protein product [Rotaria sp. Silwood2]|nr:unnamed protein product [Rotaria sp. Silwood2]
MIHYLMKIDLGLLCNSNVCLNGGTCDYNNTNMRCICPTDFAGARCEWNSVCSTNTCLNGGTCRQIAATMAECLCATGFTGPTCSLRDSCANFLCKNGAGCKTLLTDTSTNWSAYRCVCPPGFYGQNCDTSVTSCANMLCPAYKICNEQPTGPVCTCPGNKVGTFCQYENSCTLSSSSYCFNGGTCVSSNTDPPIALCLCREGFTGSYCNMTQQNNPCASNPCQTHGYCALSISNTTYSCISQSNYIGDQCERINPCLSSPCLNQAICQSYWNTTNTCEYVLKQLNSNSKIYDYSFQLSNIDDGKFELADDDDKTTADLNMDDGNSDSFSCNDDYTDDDEQDDSRNLINMTK